MDNFDGLKVHSGKTVTINTYIELGNTVYKGKDLQKMLYIVREFSISFRDEILAQTLVDLGVLKTYGVKKFLVFRGTAKEGARFNEFMLYLSKIIQADILKQTDLNVKLKEQNTI